MQGTHTPRDADTLALNRSGTHAHTLSDVGTMRTLAIRTAVIHTLRDADTLALCRAGTHTLSDADTRGSLIHCSSSSSLADANHQSTKVRKICSQEQTEHLASHR